jgi:lauroyl/myristoyl acyltransferase
MRRIDSEDLYFLTAIALIRLAAWSRSPRLADALANTVARVASLVPTARRRLMISRIASGLDPWATMQPRAIAQRTYRAFWQDAFALAGTIQPADAQRMPVEGLEHLQQALAAGHGAILLESTFFGRRHLGKIVLHAHGMKVAQVHATDHLAGFWSERETQVRRRTVRPFLEACERRFVEEILYVSRTDQSLAFTRQLLNVLQGNRVLCISGEGRIGQKAVQLPFLGQERRFVTGAMSLAKLAGAPLLPFFCWRDLDDRVHVVIDPPIDLHGSARSTETGAAAYAHLLETYVRRFPSEYYGWHVG